MAKWREQPCWTCQNACGGCSWSNFLEPVKGWTAERTTKNTVSGRGYKITYCPEYIPDEPQNVKKFHRLTIYDKQRVRQMYENGYKYEAIKAETGISMQMICDIINDRK